MNDYSDILMADYELRERMIASKWRPRYHFLPPAGRWNDVNGAYYHAGRFHLGYLQKISNAPGKLDFSSWQHISSKDLLHWTYHSTSLRIVEPDSKGGYFNSGGMIRNSEIPTIITNASGQGICIYQCFDSKLEYWEPLPQNPVIKIDEYRTCNKFPEAVIFDPSGWKEGDVYYALIGNKNLRPGYEGDSTSLFCSKNLIDWEYIGPFYKSSRAWTSEFDDCACSDFFPFGDKYMLLMHSHEPYYKCQYYIGEYKNLEFIPEHFDRISNYGAMLSGAETLLDDKGRRLFWGWIDDAVPFEESGWSGVMTLPWHLIPDKDKQLKIIPAEEISQLRYDPLLIDDIYFNDSYNIKNVDAFKSDCMEIEMQISSEAPIDWGIKLLCSPDREEETVITYSWEIKSFVIDFSRSSKHNSLRYHKRTDGRDNIMKQIVPYPLEPGSDTNLRIFVDRSVIEIFVDEAICIVQRVYPVLTNSREVVLFSHGAVLFKKLKKWEMEPTNPW